MAINGNNNGHTGTNKGIIMARNGNAGHYGNENCQDGNKNGHNGNKNGK